MASWQTSRRLILMALSQESQGLFESAGYQIHYTGLGKVKAALACSKLITERKPEWVLNLGTAGSRRFPVGQLVECTRFVQRDPIFALFPQKEIQVEPLTSLPTTICGSGDFIEMGPPSTAYDVFDMEAYALASACESHQVRFSCLKFISDSSDKNVVHDWKKNLRVGTEALLAQLKKL